MVCPAPAKISAIRKVACDPAKSYVLTGGLGGFGLELAQWLVERGARKLVFTSRTGIKTGFQSLCIQRWRDSGIEVIVSTANIGNLSETRDLLKQASILGPVGGIFNLAMVSSEEYDPIRTWISYRCNLSTVQENELFI